MVTVGQVGRFRAGSECVTVEVKIFAFTYSQLANACTVAPFLLRLSTAQDLQVKSQ